MITTRAAVLHEMGRPRPYADSQPLFIEQVQLDPPGPREVLVEITYAGLCHSDLSVIDGSRPRVMPMVLGHEASGVVRETGAEVRRLAVGDHVIFSFVPTCGRCGMCLSGRAALCSTGAKANTAGTLLDGGRRFHDGHGAALNHHLGVSGFSQFTVSAEESLVKIDPDLPLNVAAMFGCAVLTGVGAVMNTANVPAGASVAVFGLGGVGLSVVMGAVAAGACPVIAVDRLEHKLTSARRLGATHTVHAGTDDPAQAIRDITSGGADYVFESVGNETVLASAYVATARGGTTVAIGLPHPDKRLSIPVVNFVGEERTLKGSYMGSAVPQRDVPRFVRLYLAGRLPVNELQSSVLSLDAGINQAFDKLADGEVVRQLIRLDGQ